MPSISIFGLGYVGSVTAACLAKMGHRVVGVDPVAIKNHAINSGQSPIVEAELDELVASGKRAGLISATADSRAAIAETDFSFISVGTPSQRNGRLELGHVRSVCREIGAALRQKDSFHWVVLRSTVLPGTTETEVIPVLEESSGKRAGEDFGVCFNPEFLREGSAVKDFFQPPFTVIGAARPARADAVAELYSWCSAPLYHVSAASAEMVKYVCNAFHALKVSFANEVGTICTYLGVDAKSVAEIFTADRQLNISPAYLTPGFAFGGSCLPKDLRALQYCGKQLDLHLPLIESILASNAAHIDRAVEAVLHTGGRKIGVLGLSFKAGTDDLRESPVVQFVKRLIGEGRELKIWDEKVALGQLIGSNRLFIETEIPHIGALLCNDQRTVVQTADVVVIATRALDKNAIRSQLRAEQALIDIVSTEAPRAVIGKVSSAAAR